MSFKENPYGDPIPSKYLSDKRVMRNGRTLGEFNQDGNVLDSLFNQKGKASAAEVEETVQFSDVFQRLEAAGHLCPSNFVAEIIIGLESWDAEHNTRHNDDFYCKTIARGLRTFASLLRERNLKEIVDEFLRDEAARRGRGYKMLPQSVKEDVIGKTDISIKYAGALYRIWSYQSTQDGVNKTSKRILRGAGRGRNILMPFDIGGASKVHGWAMYSVAYVRDIVTELIIKQKGPAPTYASFKGLIKNDPNVVAKPAIFDVP
jgi:hypothetical protein